MISAVCRDLGLKLQMDGSRFAHACATLNCAPADITWRCGVDVLYFGGTKNGMAFGEAVIFFDAKLAEGFDYRCKKAGHLASKMRFLSAPWISVLESGAWLRNAQHANACAQYFATRLQSTEGIGIIFSVESNAVFFKTSNMTLEKLQEFGWHFYTFIGGGARFMFALDANVKNIDRLANDVKQAISESE